MRERTPNEIAADDMDDKAAAMEREVAWLGPRTPGGHAFDVDALACVARLYRLAAAWVRARAGAAGGKPHDFVPIAVFGDGVNGSKDTIAQCARCNMVRHDYEYDGGKRSPNYPTFHIRGQAVRDEGCTRGDMTEEEAMS